MAAVATRRVRTSQPQQLAQVDFANSLTANIVSLLLPTAFPAVDVVTGQTLTAVSSPVMAGGLGGTCLQTNGSNNYAWRNATDLSTAGKYTLMAVVQSNGNGTDTRLLSLGNSGSSGGAIVAIGAGLSNAQKIRLYSRNDSTSGPTDVDSNGTPFDGKLHTVVMTIDLSGATGKLSLYIDGVLDTTASGSEPVSVTTVNVIALGAFLRLSASGFWKGSVFLAGVWNRVLEDNEARSLSANPWQLFKPQSRRLWFAGGTSVNGTATISGVSATSGVGTITATGGASTTLAGDSGQSGTGTITATGGATAGVTGVSAAASLASITATGGASTSVTGVSAASGVASITGAGDANVNVSGVSATASVASITATGSGDAVASLSGVSAAGGVGTIDASGTSGDATASLQGVSATAHVGTIVATGTSTTIAVDITEDMVCRVVRNYILSIVPNLPVKRTPVNRASMPKGPYVSFTPGLRRPLSTNVSHDDATSRTVGRPEQMSFQIDCYGLNSAQTAETINLLYRDQYACDVFESLGFNGAPLYAGDIQQAPYVTGEDQYEDRYTFEIELQLNPSVVIPLQSCNILNVDLINVPPSEE